LGFTDAVCLRRQTSLPAVWPASNYSENSKNDDFNDHRAGYWGADPREEKERVLIKTRQERLMPVALIARDQDGGRRADFAATAMTRPSEKLMHRLRS